MIMQEQELMLFGGWAKALIPQPIEIGVVEPLEEPSVSIYIKSEYAEEPFTVEACSRVRPLQIAADPPKITTYMGLLIEVEIFESYQVGYSTRETTITNNWQHKLLEDWKQLALYRFFEIWNKGSLDDMMRGYQGSKSLRMSFSGKIGCNNDRGIAAGKGALTKLPSGDWTLTHKSELKNPYRRKLPPEGVENVRRFARELRDHRVSHSQGILK